MIKYWRIGLFVLFIGLSIIWFRNENKLMGLTDFAFGLSMMLNPIFYLEDIWTGKRPILPEHSPESRRAKWPVVALGTCFMLIGVFQFFI